MKSSAYHHSISPSMRRTDVAANGPASGISALKWGVSSMAKSRAEAVNKSQAIRDALSAHPEKSPSEVAELLKAKGLKLNAKYVSTIKSNAKAKRLKVVKRRKPGHVVPGDGSAEQIMKAGLHFILLAGGVEAARERLVGLEELIEAAKQVE